MQLKSQLINFESVATCRWWLSAAICFSCACFSSAKGPKVDTTLEGTRISYTFTLFALYPQTIVQGEIMARDTFQEHRFDIILLSEYVLRSNIRRDPSLWAVIKESGDGGHITSKAISDSHSSGRTTPVSRSTIVRRFACDRKYWRPSGEIRRQVTYPVLLSRIKFNSYKPHSSSSRHSFVSKDVAVMKLSLPWQSTNRIASLLLFINCLLIAGVSMSTMDMVQVPSREPEIKVSSL